MTNSVSNMYCLRTSSRVMRVLGAVVVPVYRGHGVCRVSGEPADEDLVAYER